MRFTIALVLLAACRADLVEPPPGCDSGDALHAIVCEGEALGAWVSYKTTQYEACRWTGAMVVVDGEMLTGTVVDRYRWQMGEWTLEAAVSPTRLLVTRGKQVATVKECTEE